MRGVGLSGRVTWENFLEELGERFGWVLAQVLCALGVFELASFVRSSE